VDRLLQPFADIGIDDGDREQRAAGSNEYDVEHGAISKMVVEEIRRDGI
jgi:hypothetical protein